MNNKEYQDFYEADVSIKVEDLKDKNNKTLLLGFDYERYIFHLYLRDGKFSFVFYEALNGVEKYQKEKQISTSCSCFTIGHEAFFSEVLSNVKRLYPEACNLEFCKLLKEAGVILRFMPFSSTRYNKILLDLEEFTYLGKTIGDLEKPEDD